MRGAARLRDPQTYKLLPSFLPHPLPPLPLPSPSLPFLPPPPPSSFPSSPPLPLLPSALTPFPPEPASFNAPSSTWRHGDHPKSILCASSCPTRVNVGAPRGNKRWESSVSFLGTLRLAHSTLTHLEAWDLAPPVQPVHTAQSGVWPPQGGSAPATPSRGQACS